jgi:hypothetical protein
VVYVRKKRNRHRVLMGKPVRKNRLEDMPRWWDIKTVLKSQEGRSADGIHLGQDGDKQRALANKVINLHFA